MESKIKTTDQGIEIDITNVEDKKDELLQAFQECSEGRCTCPTQEYQKVAELQVIEGEDEIQLSIIAKDGEQIATAEIEKCLEHTKKRVGG